MIIQYNVKLDYCMQYMTKVTKKIYLTKGENKKRGYLEGGYDM